jgi:hypothetical protein
MLLHVHVQVGVDGDPWEENAHSIVMKGCMAREVNVGRDEWENTDYAHQEE